MGHHKIREDKTCLNCGHEVEGQFCSNCGQKNIEPRQPFYYLFTHFIEDLVHYDGKFWRTIHYLLFKPGQLTTAYLAGKRQQFVAPVKLYIFISFVTFVILSLSSQNGKPNKNDDILNEETTSTINEDYGTDSTTNFKIIDKIDSLLIEIPDTLHFNPSPKDTTNNNHVKLDLKDNSIILDFDNLQQFDSTYQIKSPRFHTYSRPIIKKYFELKEQGITGHILLNNIRNSFTHTLPKGIFLYLPIFAFLLWIFHNKKKWWYFDHGIFTLHYFSFLLVVTIIMLLISNLTQGVNLNSTINYIINILSFIFLIYSILYFYYAHNNVYKIGKRKSFAMGILMFILNSFGLIIMLLIILYTSFLFLH